MTADSSYRMSVELPNGAKFRAQGDVADVRVDFERFYALTSGITTTPTKLDVTGPTKTIPTNGTNSTNGNHAPSVEIEQPTMFADTIENALMERLFTKDRNGTVSLRALPRGESAQADALIALIYGAGKLANEQQVTGSRLMKAATQSGLHQLDRIDRALVDEIGQHVTTAGFKRGRRYGLTNPGIRRAEEILRGILG